MEDKDLILNYRCYTLRYPAHSHLSVGGTINIPNCITFFVHTNLYIGLGVLL